MNYGIDFCNVCKIIDKRTTTASTGYSSAFTYTGIRVYQKNIINKTHSYELIKFIFKTINIYIFLFFRIYKRFFPEKFSCVFVVNLSCFVCVNCFICIKIKIKLFSCSLLTERYKPFCIIFKLFRSRYFGHNRSGDRHFNIALTRYNVCIVYRFINNVCRQVCKTFPNLGF